jgi:DNA polymerase-3 subunit gamma/tau
MLDALHADGADPIQIVGDLAEAIHAATRIKAAGEEAAAALSSTERARAKRLAGRLSMAALARAWQMLLKGLEEVGRAPRAIAAAEMLLIRMCYAADLPPPEDIIRRLTAKSANQTKGEPSHSESRTSSGVPDSLSGNGAPPSGRRAVGSDEPVLSDRQLLDQEAPAAPRLASFADVVALAAAKRDVRLKMALEDAVELVRFKPGHIELHLLPDAQKEVANDLGRKLKHWTGERWMISVTEERGERPLGEVRREREAKMLEEARRHPTVQSVLRHFPDAEITAVRDLSAGDGGTKKN